MDRRAKNSQDTALPQAITVAFTKDELIELLNSGVLTAYHAIEDDDNEAWRVVELAVSCADKIEAALPMVMASPSLLCAEELGVLRKRLVAKRKSKTNSATTKPCDERDHWWLRAERERDGTKDMAYSGKWLLYIDCPWIEAVWAQIVADVRTGLLGPTAKVSTHRPSPLAKPGKHVICVYTESAQDLADVRRVALQLVKSARLKRMTIHYKTDAATLAGVYRESSPDGVALYSFGPPYKEVKTLRY